MELWRTGEHGFVHLPDCFMLASARRQGGTPVLWDGTGSVRACRRCILRGRKAAIRRPCRRCNHRSAQPCRHNGTLSVRSNGKAEYAGYRWADQVIEADWLRSLLD